MDYIFTYSEYGTEEILKTIGAEHTSLFGFQEVTREYPDCIITDGFYAVKKIKSSEDPSGRCYDWYLISNHYRYVDNTVEVVKKQEQDRADIDYIAMETGVEL